MVSGVAVGKLGLMCVFDHRDENRLVANVERLFAVMTSDNRSATDVRDVVLEPERNDLAVLLGDLDGAVVLTKETLA